MANALYTELQGNEPILKAVEYLRMLPEWKEKPGKLRSGHVEFAQVLARYLVNLYCTYEGKPLTEKLDLMETTDPLAQEAESASLVRAMDESSKLYKAKLDRWHLELSMCFDGIRYVTEKVDDEQLGSIAHVINHRAEELLGSCPFPE